MASISWMWEGLRKDKGVETKAFKKGTYDHPTPTNELRPMNPDIKDSPLHTVVTAINTRLFMIQNLQKRIGIIFCPKGQHQKTKSISI